MVDRRTPYTPSLTTLLLGAAFLFALTQPLLSGDLGWHIRVGQYVLDRRAVPHLNFLCFTCPWYHWLTHEWLADVLLAITDAAGGLPLLFVVRGLLFSSTLYVLSRLGRYLDADPLALAALMLLMAVTLALNVALRPWMFTNLLLALTLLALEAIQRYPGSYRRWWLIAPVLGVWANLHGGFAVGLALVALTLTQWVVCRRPRDGAPKFWIRTATGFGVLLASLATLLLNPHGLEVLVLPFDYLLGEPRTGLALISSIKEWSPIELSSFFGGIYLLWCGLALLCLIVSREARRRPETYVAIVFLLLTLKAQRHLPLGALVLFPVVCFSLARPLGVRLRRSSRPRLGFVAGLSAREAVPRGPFLAIVIAACFGYFATLAWDDDFEARAMRSKGYPWQAVRALASSPPKRVFNHCDWAGLIAWQAPEWKLFITPVFDAHPRSLMQDWLTIANLKTGWRTRLELYRVEAVFMPADSALVRQLKADGGWAVALEDPYATLLVKLPPR